ncbi:TetR family transcriptional regulator [Winogradskya consettensis]|uniref:TetR family transcriptional regulator n=1 Tax=Winogradskya consettensis TaxID=113560 RepID=A0A919VNH9_9ACTN|nr:TetR family transcriptional regulator [Actinoplanes consettensis]
MTAARRRFGRDGYERTTLRLVAADVGVDPAMAVRYFKTKEALFAAAADFDLRLPDLSTVRPEQLADVLLPRFFAVWEEEGTFLPLLRASTGSPAAAEAMREVFAAQVAPAIGALAVDHPLQRAGLLGALILGLAMTRYVMQAPAMADLSRDQLTAWIRPLMHHILTGPAPALDGLDVTTRH